MNPKKIKFFDGETDYDVNIIVPDFNDMAIGSVIINGKKSYVVRWNYGLRSKNIGFPTSLGRPIWFLLAENLKPNIEF